MKDYLFNSAKAYDEAVWELLNLICLKLDVPKTTLKSIVENVKKKYEKELDKSQLDEVKK